MIAVLDRFLDWRGGLGYLLTCAATIPAGWVAIWAFGWAQG